MLKPSHPPNEQARIAALKRLDVLDSQTEEAFDQITRLASSICGSSIALVSLIDEERQWFKSHHGLDETETSRDISFCGHAIHQSEVFEVSDSRKDERFHDNPLVTGDTKVIFYAGAPLITQDGFALGTLCVIDDKPATLSSKQKHQLSILAGQVVHLLELRKANIERIDALDQAEKLTQQIQQKNDQLEQFVYAVSHDLKAPLVSIGGFAARLNHELAQTTTDKEKHRFQRIAVNVEHTAQLLDDLLVLSRILNNEIEKTWLDVETLVENEWRLINKNQPISDVQFTIVAPLAPIFVHESLLSQCMSNLFSNATRYRDVARPLHISVFTQTHDDYTSIYVQDTGIGIDQAFHHKIFDVFEQINDGEGSGIGLSIVKGAVDKHGGTIHLTSSLGEGSKFELRFPHPTNEIR